MARTYASMYATARRVNNMHASTWNLKCELKLRTITIIIFDFVDHAIIESRLRIMC